MLINMHGYQTICKALLIFKNLVLVVCLGAARPPQLSLQSPAILHLMGNHHLLYLQYLRHLGRLL